MKREIAQIDLLSIFRVSSCKSTKLFIQKRIDVLEKSYFCPFIITMQKMSIRKILLILFTVCLTASCTRVRNKVVDWLRTSSNFEEYHVRQLYPSLGQDNDCGVCEEWPLYKMWFRYQGTPKQVESAIIAKECSYTEITPDSAFISCDRNYILEEQSLHQRIDFFDEWETLPEDHLLYYRCTRTPHRHLFVFDTVTGYVYHHMVEFRE